MLSIYRPHHRSDDVIPPLKSSRTGHAFTSVRAHEVSAIPLFSSNLHTPPLTLPSSTLTPNSLTRSSHLADLAPSSRTSTSGGRTRRLRLLSLLLALRARLLLLALQYGFLAGGLTGFGALAASVFDEFEGGADDTALLFEGAAGAFLGCFLGSC